ncbi:MAG: hypothetical protein UT13_C0001G0603 [Candidatus Pacebacteria bacterium GW2011_GWF2_38_9]|nr:MAG: hypothetical protein US01_C0001G0621 [candidate division TM6 bacterium GW2011_GWF2_28_16]KKQ88956.1 MAG: hypothetical protein UT13_C0001G0603 [Candidatus Pacebacteria bacterium GW2011_GWF2_38_9]HAZ73131.1 hypothetical protein [Candidatus Paceibacterota bacterium]
MEKNLVISDVEKTLYINELRLYKKLKNFGAYSIEEIASDFGFSNKEFAKDLLQKLEAKLNSFGKETIRKIKIGRNKFPSYYIESVCSDRERILLADEFSSYYLESTCPDEKGVLFTNGLRLYKKLKNFGAYSVKEISSDFGFSDQELANDLLQHLKTKLNDFGKETIQEIQIGKDEFPSYYIEKER